MRGSIDIPEGWTDFGLSFKNKTKNQNLGTFEKLEPRAAGSIVKIYDSPEDFFSDEELEQNKNGSLPDNAKNQKVTFARDPENPRKLQFCAVFDDVGEIEVKIKFGPNGTEGIAGHTLTTDAVMADFIDTMNERVASIEVPGSEELPIDLDGDGSSDGSPNNDLIQARQPGSMAIPGALLSEELEDNPLNLVLRINDDQDDANGQADNANTAIGANDNDVSRLLLKRPGNLAANVGTLTLTVAGGNAVRVFNSNGSAVLSTYTVNLASPVGDLAALVNGSVPIYVEGLAESADVTFTLTYRNALNVVVASDSIHLTVTDADNLALLRMLNGFQSVAGNSRQIQWRTYADNGAWSATRLDLAPIGQNPPLQNRGMLSKVFWDVTKRSVQSQLAWTKGFVDGFWVALKGEKETVVGVWTFFRDDPFGRSAAMYGAVKEAIGELKNIPAGEIPGLLSTISKNLWEDLYTSAEQALPWAPVDPPPALVLKYMEGFATGTIAEGVGVSLLGVGVVTKSATVIKGIIASCKVGRYALTSLGALRKATAKTMHIMLRLAKSENGSIQIGGIAKRLEKIALPSGKKVPEVFEEALHDKPELTDKVVEAYHYHGQAIADEARAATRFQKCAHSLAEVKDIMGNSLTDDGLESFAKLQKRMFVKGADNADCLPELKQMFDLDSAAGKTHLNEFLEDAKQFLDNPNSAALDGGFPVPDYKGFVKLPVDQNLPVGTIIDRYGTPAGGYLSPVGTPPWARSLRPGTADNPPIRYRVAQPLTVSSGRAAPWYNQPGGGIQFQLQNNKSVSQLLAEGILEPAP